MVTAILESIVGRLASLWHVCLTKMKENYITELTCLTKGIVYELSLLRKAYYNIIPWSQFYDWAKELWWINCNV